jgi:outer membrane protein TolC
MSRQDSLGVLRRTAVFLSMFVLAAGSASAQSADTVTLTLDEVVRRAVLNSPQVVQAEGAVQTAGASELSAIGSFLPNLNISSGAALSSTQRFDPNTNTNVTGSSDSYNAGVSSSMDLFTGGRRGAQLTQARAETRASEASLVEQRYAVTRNAKAAYFDVARASDLIRSAQARLQRAEEGLGAGVHCIHSASRGRPPWRQVSGGRCISPSAQTRCTPAASSSRQL